MSATFTVWRLRCRERSCRCLITGRDNRWRLIVWRDDRIALCEAYPTDDLALLRATDLWRTLGEHGWRDPLLDGEADVITRRCPACDEPTGAALIRVFHEITFLCRSCDHGWTDRARVALADRRRSTRDTPDRRVA